MRNFTRTALAMGAGALVATAAGAIAVSAATSTAPKPPPAGTKGVHHCLHRVPRLAGLVTSEFTGSGVFSKGQITVTPPDGKALTLSLTPATKILLYHGPGQKPTVETIGQLKPRETVIVTGRGLFGKRHLARHILDLGIQGTVPG
ncbi:MAG: hypothetical protein ACYCYK_00610 [Candidatus Dormibacteria bacterium]